MIKSKRVIIAISGMNDNRDRLDSTAVMTRYGLFFGGYRKRRYYWETMIAGRKASVVMLRVFGPAMGVRGQAMTCLLLLLFLNLLLFLSFHIAFKNPC